MKGEPEADCKYCGVSLTEAETAKHEQVCPKKPRSFVCTICWNTFDTFRALNGHQNAHQPKRR